MHLARSSRPVRPLLPMTLIAAALATPVGLAQPAAPSSDSQPSAAVQPPPAKSPRPRPPQAEPGPLLSVEFAGGTLGQFVSAVKAACAEPINVVVPAEAASMQVPTLSLKSVSPFMALQSLEYINTRGNTQVPGGAVYRAPGAMLKVAQLNMESHVNATSGSAPTFAIVYERLTTPPAGSPGSALAVAPVTKVYSVADLLSSDAEEQPGLTLDRIVHPVETALTVDAGDDPADPPKVMVHRESSLIIVRGSPRQAELAKQVIDRLHDDVTASRDRVRPQRELRQAIIEITRQRQAEMAAADKLLASTGAQVERSRAMLEKVRKDKPDDIQAIESLRRALEVQERDHQNVSLTVQRLQAEAGNEEAAARKLLAERDRFGSAMQEVRQLRAQLEDLRKQIQDVTPSKGR